MKKHQITIRFMLCLLFASSITLSFVSCQQKQFFTDSPEIQSAKKGNEAYLKGDWKTFKDIFSDTARIFVNTIDKDKAFSIDEYIQSLQDELKNIQEYKQTNQIYSMVIDDKKEKWVEMWFLWEAKSKDGQQIKTPVHIAARYVDGKCVEQYNYFDAKTTSLNSSNDVEQIKATIKNMVMDFNDPNPEKFFNYLDDNTVTIPVGRPVRTGKADVMEFHRDFRKNYMTHITIDNIENVNVSGDLGVVQCASTEVVTNKSTGDKKTYNEKTLMVLQKNSIGEWKLRNVIWN